MPDPVEELLGEWPEPKAFGVEWVRAWAPHGRERLVKIAKVLRRYPWMAEVVRRRPVANPHPYMVETYVAKDGSEACISLNQLKAYCARGGEGDSWSRSSADWKYCISQSWMAGTRAEEG